MQVPRPPELIIYRNVPAEWTAVEHAAEVLNAVSQLIGKEIGTKPIQPSPHSPYAVDYELHSEFASFLAARARDHFLYAVDHANAVTKTIRYDSTRRENANSCAAWTCARAVLEFCSTASWFIDTGDGVASRDRFRRYFDYILRDPADILRQSQKKQAEYERLLGMSLKQIKEDHDSAVSLINDWSAKLGITATKWRGNPKRPEFTEDLKPSELADRYFESGAWHYRSYSAVAHGAYWATTRLWLIGSDTKNPYHLLYHPKLALSIIIDVNGWLTQTARRIYAYHGWDMASIEDTSRQALEKLEWYRPHVAAGPSVVSTS